MVGVSLMMQTKGLKHAYLKKRNISNILKVIFEKESISRKDIASYTGLTAATVSNLITELINSGLVEEVGSDPEYFSSKGGSNPILLSLTSKKHFIISVHCGLTSINIGLVNLKGELIDGIVVEMKSDYNLPQLISLISNHVQNITLMNDISITNNILGIGVGMAGLVDSNQGILIWHEYDFLKNVNFKKLLEEKFNKPVYIDNIINTLALMEVLYGKGKKYSNYLFVFVGGIVGSAIVNNGKIMKGKRNLSCMLGHKVIKKNGPMCTCGKKGCLEALVSDLALNREANYLKAANKGLLAEIVRDGKLTKELLVEATKKGDKYCSDLFINRGKYIGKAIADMVNLIDFETVIVLDSTPSQLDIEYQAILDSYKKNVDVNNFVPEPVPEILISDYKRELIPIGPASLVISKIFNSELNIFQDDKGKTIVKL